MIPCEKTIGNKTLRLIAEDLTERAVDAIVNAANSRLQHGGGVAGAIVRKGGRIIQDESDAVGPMMGEGDEDAKLRSAITSVLALAAERGFRTIAVPAISAGIFGFPRDRCAAILVGETAAFLKQRPDSSLETVEFCITDAAAFPFFEREFGRIH